MAANANENKFSISWHDSAWIPILNSENVIDYFCQRSNTFYDKTCNNEHVKMQRLNPAQLQYMTGIEYEHIHAQEPILYVIRKQMRHSPTQVTSLAIYYILGGIVYQAPDIGSLINSKLLSTVHKLQSSFAEAQSYASYNPSKGYWWQFKDIPDEKKVKEKKKNKAHEPSSIFQRQRVNILLNCFAQKFPPKSIQEKTKTEPTENTKPSDVKVEVKEEPVENGNLAAVVKTEPNIISSSSLSQVTSLPVTTSNTDTAMTKSTGPIAKKRKKE